MSAEGLPAVARRRVRNALRAAREASGQSQAAVAGALGWSMSKLQRIELGEVTVSPDDLRVMLEHYRIPDEEWADLVEDARIARRERYWSAEHNWELIPAGLRHLLQFETAATRMTIFQPHVLPGSLQTPRTAEAILEGWQPERDAEQAQAIRRARAQRRERVTGDAAVPDFRLMLDESVLWRVVGDRSVTAEQFLDLVEVAERPNVRVRILPFDRGALAGTMGGFTLIQFDPDDPADTVLYRERLLQDEVVDGGAEVAVFLRYFDRFWSEAMDEGVTAHVIRARAAQLSAEAAQEVWRTGLGPHR
ncbi:transcriptional regulator [Actinoplanes cyaneus]|uniref:Transcriptional regulator n=1 Tax=Actinoplanes cyaneus TaxID=52696 RepID=A0A919ICH6_9ACTN|nr:helix-turn-helix transcriptional regulator [Actinoplanes cyaneus]MCW2135888.1 Helix-turn-helix domain-containing protein [Actinoplanes cyaneus]GID62746.1 transcriptional regulator [Actinoplanes cyaneus]